MTTIYAAPEIVPNVEITSDRGARLDIDEPTLILLGCDILSKHCGRMSISEFLLRLKKELNTQPAAHIWNNFCRELDRHFTVSEPGRTVVQYISMSSRHISSDNFIG
jgi:hypothetical protein